MPAAVLVDTNVILDIATDDQIWSDWSSAALERAADESVLVINPLIYADVSVGLDSIEALDEILELAGPRSLAGIVATNTTLWRPESVDPQCRRVYAEAGGLSGKPLGRRSTEIIRHLYRQTRGQLPIIGVGGILDAADAWEKITAGATLLQIYTGLVYEGPGVVREMVEGLWQRLQERGMTSLWEAIGTGEAGTSSP